MWKTQVAFASSLLLCWLFGGRQMSQLINFYRGKGKDLRGRSIQDIWNYSDDELECIHDFIQWLFPLRVASQYNPTAPLLTDTIIAEFRSDPKIQANLLRSFTVFLAFLGLEYENGVISESPNIDMKNDVWRFPNHNWLRITRVLSSTRILGLELQSRLFLEHLKSMVRTGRAEITPETMGYWEQAVMGGNPSRK
jgi:hypothetical protein